ncbi:MAG: TRAP transporter small permease subunit [Gammaproteobacteria bacterium]|nr:TRAP transporter small permease subunit [Gammaproteobacteria bacterium]
MIVSAVFLYLINNYLVYWQNWPGTWNLLSHYGFLGLEKLDPALSDELLTQGWLQFTIYLGILILSFLYAVKTRARTLLQDSIRFAGLAAYIIRVSFWSVLLIGFADMIISFLRVEDLLEFWVGEHLKQQLGRPIFRGTWVHYPLIILSCVLAARFRSISFSWLAIMVVLAEFSIVITRFVFSYEQAYMGDIVRFWYAGLFLFASAYTLVEEGHVRVDVLYAGFSRRKKAWIDVLGCTLLGMPICWVILMHGMGGKGNSINSPLLSFEVTQSGYGMYVKYLMAGFLVVFAVSMLVQFVSYLLFNISEITRVSDDSERPSYRQLIASGKAG